MRALLYTIVGLTALTLFSCAPIDKPVGPTSKKTDMPWSQSGHTTGGGPMGMLDQR